MTMNISMFDRNKFRTWIICCIYNDQMKRSKITYHRPKLPYFFFSSSIRYFIGDCFRYFGLDRLFSRLFVLRRVNLNGIPFIPNSVAKLRSKKR